MYEQAYAMCRNLENVMGIFSEELKILDQNTVQLMIDDMQDTINFQKDALSKKDAAIAQKDAAIAQMRKEIERLKAAHAAD